MAEENKKPTGNNAKNNEKNMANYNVEHITTLEQALSALEACYLNPFLEYCKSDVDKNSYKSNVLEFT
jgi:hypothetical protein